MSEPRDLWWEARERTRRMSQPTLWELAVNKVMSLRGRPTREVFSRIVRPFGSDQYPIIVDLNKYRMRDLKPYVDAGVDFFVLRMGGPRQWVYDNWMYALDETFKPLFEQADLLGIRDRIMGYWIHNAGANWTAENEDVHGDLVEQWTSGGYMPRMIFSDFEVATQWRNGVQETLTPYNLRMSLETSTAKIQKRFSKKKVGIYSARWFINSYCFEHIQTYMDNVNRPIESGGVGVQRPTWLAWWPQAFTKQYILAQTAMDELLAPTSDQKTKFLGIGSYSAATMWQFTASLRIGADTQGVDASVSMVPLAEMLSALDISLGTPPEPEPEPTDPPIVDLTPILNRLDAVEDQVGKIQDWIISGTEVM